MQLHIFSLSQKRVPWLILRKKIAFCLKNVYFIEPQNQRFRLKRGCFFSSEIREKGVFFKLWVRAWYTLWSGVGGWWWWWGGGGGGMGGGGGGGGGVVVGGVVGCVCVGCVCVCVWRGGGGGGGGGVRPEQKFFGYTLELNNYMSRDCPGQQEINWGNKICSPMMAENLTEFLDISNSYSPWFATRATSIWEMDGWIHSVRLPVFLCTFQICC